MREHPNIAVVRCAYEAVSRGERGTLREIVAPGVHCDVMAALYGDHDADAYRARTIVPLALAAAGDLVVAIDHLCTRRGGRPIDAEGVVVFSVVDRRIATVVRMM